MKLEQKTKKTIFLIALVGFFLSIIVLQLKSLLSSDHPIATADSTKLNRAFPSPKLNEKDKTKMELYMQSKEDSLRKLRDNDNPAVRRFFTIAPTDSSLSPSGADWPVSNKIALQEKQLNEHLNKIMNEVNRSPEQFKAVQNETASADEETLKKLDHLMKGIQNDTAGNKEMEQMERMLDKILEIKQSISTDTKRPQSDSGILTVSTSPGKIADQQFLNLNTPGEVISATKAAIKAVIQADQTVQDGATVKLRLLVPMFVGTAEIPVNSFIYGTAKIADERLRISIERVLFQNFIFPVKLNAYDLDGMEGISIPGAITNDATKQGLDRAMQTISLSTFDPSIGTQAANAGLQSLQSLLRKKVQIVRVSIKAEHQVYLQ